MPHSQSLVWLESDWWLLYKHHHISHQITFRGCRPAAWVTAINATESWDSGPLHLWVSEWVSDWSGAELPNRFLSLSAPWDSWGGRSRCRWSTPSAWSWTCPPPPPACPPCRPPYIPRTQLCGAGRAADTTRYDENTVKDTYNSGGVFSITPALTYPHRCDLKAAVTPLQQRYWGVRVGQPAKTLILLLCWPVPQMCLHKRCRQNLGERLRVSSLVYSNE